MFRRPFYWRELLDQIWFVARVSIVPTVMLSMPYTVLIVFTLNVVLLEVGAGDLSGEGGLASVTQVGPVVAAAIVVSGAGATAMCADLGARTIRGDRRDDSHRRNPIQALVVPRVIAATFVAADALLGRGGRRAHRQLRLRGLRPARDAGILRGRGRRC